MMSTKTIERAEKKPRHWYGYYNDYGVGTVDGETGRRIGTLYRFDSPCERNQWVWDESTFGDIHREALSYREAKHEVGSLEMYFWGED